MHMRNLTPLLCFAVAFCGIGRPGMAQSLPIPFSFTRDINYLPVGLASSETMQVNVVNLAANSSNGTMASCTGSISFFNAAGTAIGTASSFTVTAGATSSVTLTLLKAGITGVRAEIRAVVHATTMIGHNAAPCSLGSSLETFDSTLGVTHVYVSNAGVPTAVPVLVNTTTFQQ